MAVLWRQFQHPNFLDSSFQFSQRAGMFSLYFTFHSLPHVHDWVNIRRIPWPIENWNIVISNPRHWRLRRMAGSAILHECGAPMQVHYQRYSTLKDLDISGWCHSFILLQEFQCTPASPAETVPNHYGIRMLNSWYSKSFSISCSNWSSDKLCQCDLHQHKHHSNQASHILHFSVNTQSLSGTKEFASWSGSPNSVW